MKKLFFILILFFCLGCSDSMFSLAPDVKNLNYNPLFNSKVDILMIVDDSGSMDVHQGYLATSVPGFTSRLISLGFDFQLAVTSTDLGKFGERGQFVGTPKILNAQSPDLTSKLHERILLGTQGSSVEQGLGAAKMALTEPNLSDANSGFLRDDAFLLILVLSNENDSSSGTSQDYINFFQTLKPPLPGRKQGWMLNFIGVTGQPQEDCKTFGDYKDVGTRYIDLVNFSHGIMDTICTASLKNVINNLSSALLTLLTEIPLARQPKPDTIKVTFNGLPVPNDAHNGWTYNVDKNSVSFHGSFIPQVVTQIAITYDPQTVK